MTSFNAVGAILPLDEYYKNCVHPKPLIPPKYPGAKFRLNQSAGITQEGPTRQAGHRKVGQRQAANLRSYKDEEDTDEDEEDPVGTGESVEDSQDAVSDFQSNMSQINYEIDDFNNNMSQINYEIDDFNKNYCDESSPWQNEGPNSLQGRRDNTNDAPPNVVQKSNVKSRLNLNNRWNKRNWNRNSRKNNGNTNYHPGANQNQNRGQQQQQARLMLQQHMRSAYNSFRDNNMDQSPNALMKHKNNLQNIPQNSQDISHSSTVTSMIDSSVNLGNSRTYTQSYFSYETAVQPLNAERAQVNPLPHPGIPMDLTSFNTDNYTVQQVARHVMMMMNAVRDADTQETPEYFKSKKSINAADGESHISDQPEGFN